MCGVTGTGVDVTRRRSFATAVFPAPRCSASTCPGVPGTGVSAGAATGATGALTGSGASSWVAYAGCTR